jgi:hypothetical protein
VDQSAMVLEERAAGSHGAMEAMAGEASEVQASELAMAASDAIARVPQAVVEWSAELTRAAQRAGETMGETVLEAIRLAAQAVDELPDLERAQGAAEESVAAAMQESEAVEPDDTQAPSPQAGALPAAGPSGADPARGEVTDRESVALSVRRAPAVRLVEGRVQAAEGLEIQTRRPRWTNTVIATRNPRTPTVEIVFGADGRVRRAAFVSDGATVYSTGFEDVDQPLLNAVYGWTARGKAIDELEEDGEVRILITVLFR